MGATCCGANACVEPEINIDVYAPEVSNSTVSDGEREREDDANEV